jgi:hypothetical protein
LDTSQAHLPFFACMLVMANVLVSLTLCFLFTPSICWFKDVRLAGISALIDFQPADGSYEDLEFLLDIAENDPEPRIRHEVLRMLIETPPFELAAGNPVDNPILASRLWNNIKYIEVEYFRFVFSIFSLQPKLELRLKTEM